MTECAVNKLELTDRISAKRVTLAEHELYSQVKQHFEDKNISICKAE